ncbi:MAG: hypothetical protein JKY51_10085 [Opitutaceae bacterium]|nr:hypothetical protein [Opitutaceae bacterium]
MKYVKQTTKYALLVLAMSSLGAHAFDFSTISNAVSSVAKTQQVQPKSVAASAVILKAGTANKRKVVYEGYSKEMLPVKKLIAQGKVEEAIKVKFKPGSNIDDLGALGNLELGLMMLDATKVADANKHFTKAEVEQVGKGDRGTISSLGLSLFGSALSTLSGNGELGEYSGVGYERVLMLNYKSIAYLLEGERKAYNVTRRAIELQNIEKKAFDQKIREAKKEIAEEEAAQKEKGAELEKVGFSSIIKKQFKSSDKKASKVPNAFVNPFGFYIAGVVQEFDSYEDRSLRDNARISYKKALELNPHSRVIKQAVKEIQKRAPKNRRLVHVIVGDGFAPEKKLLKFDLSMGLALPTNIELPIYEAVPSKVHRIEVQTTTGKRWSRLSEVADISALALRHQKESGPFAQLSMMTTVIRNVIEGHAWNQATQSAGVFGGLVNGVKEARETMIHPDMRSWSTLPSRLLAARIFVPKSVSRIKLVSYDKRGKKLSSKIVKLDKNSHNLVYARTIDSTMYAASSKEMWIKVK